MAQANGLGLNAVGCDVSAFNVLLCRVKTSRHDLARARREVVDILENVRNRKRAQVHEDRGERGCSWMEGLEDRGDDRSGNVGR